MSVRYLSLDEVVTLHARLLRAQGEQPMPIISPEKLEAAIARPQSSQFGEDAFPDLHQKAAALLQSIVIGHPFLDGNKRIGLAAAIAFLRTNGITTVPDQDRLYDLTIAVATGELREVEEIAIRVADLFGIPG